VPTPTPAAAVDHLWLSHPLGPETEGDRYPGTYFPYGATGGGRYHLHHGVDYANPAGTPVLAAAAGEVIVAGDDLETTLLGLLEKAEAAKAEIITAYYGQELAVQEANRLADRIRATWPDREVELHEGGQPHYPLILSVE